jgi:enoyl-CoA hydratase
MFAEIGAKLREWQTRAEVAWVMWRGEEPVGKTKAFCAGGELSEVVTEASEIAPFIGPEYELDHFISQYPKPQVAIWNGIVMGAGYGLTGSAQIRIATEHLQFAMPEARFGLNADIGCAYLLTTKCPENLGVYLTMTADRIRGGKEGVWSGLATHFVPSLHLKALYSTYIDATSEFFKNTSSSSNSQQLQPAKGLVTLLNSIANDAKSEQEEPEEKKIGRTEKFYPHIKRIFGMGSVIQIYQELKILSSLDATTDVGEDWYQWINFCLNALDVDCCPTSVCVNFEGMKKARLQGFSYADSLINDFRVAVRLSLREDIQLGAKAILHKSGPPKWSPSSVLDIDYSSIEAMFTPLLRSPSSTEERATQNLRDLELPNPSYAP